jgi:hypothetical protein
MRTTVLPAQEQRRCNGSESKELVSMTVARAWDRKRALLVHKLSNTTSYIVRARLVNLILLLEGFWNRNVGRAKSSMQHSKAPDACETVAWYS